MRRKQPEFFAMVKNFNTGEVEAYDVLRVVFDSILNSNGRIRKRKFYIDKATYRWEDIIKNKEMCDKFVKSTLMYHYWAKCEYEFIVIDWPYRDTIEKSRPVKIDVYEQLKPNLPVIADLVWNYISPKVKVKVKEDLADDWMLY